MGLLATVKFPGERRRLSRNFVTLKVELVTQMLVPSKAIPPEDVTATANVPEPSPSLASSLVKLGATSHPDTRSVKNDPFGTSDRKCTGALRTRTVARPSVLSHCRCVKFATQIFAPSNDPVGTSADGKRPQNGAIAYPQFCHGVAAQICHPYICTVRRNVTWSADAKVSYASIGPKRREPSNEELVVAATVTSGARADTLIVLLAIFSCLDLPEARSVARNRAGKGLCFCRRSGPWSDRHKLLVVDPVPPLIYRQRGGSDCRHLPR